MKNVLNCIDDSSEYDYNSDATSEPNASDSNPGHLHAIFNTSDTESVDSATNIPKLSSTDIPSLNSIHDSPINDTDIQEYLFDSPFINILSIDSNSNSDHSPLPPQDTSIEIKMDIDTESIPPTVVMSPSPTPSPSPTVKLETIQFTAPQTPVNDAHDVNVKTETNIFKVENQVKTEIKVKDEKTFKHDVKTIKKDEKTIKKDEKIKKQEIKTDTITTKLELLNLDPIPVSDEVDPEMPALIRSSSSTPSISIDNRDFESLEPYSVTPYSQSTPHSPQQSQDYIVSPNSRANLRNLSNAGKVPILHLGSPLVSPDSCTSPTTHTFDVTTNKLEFLVNHLSPEKQKEKAHYFDIHATEKLLTRSPHSQAPPFTPHYKKAKELIRLKANTVRVYNAFDKDDYISSLPYTAATHLEINLLHGKILDPQQRGKVLDALSTLQHVGLTIAPKFDVPRMCTFIEKVEKTTPENLHTVSQPLVENALDPNSFQLPFGQDPVPFSIPQFVSPSPPRSHAPRLAANIATNPQYKHLFTNLVNDQSLKDYFEDTKPRCNCCNNKNNQSNSNSNPKYHGSPAQYTVASEYVQNYSEPVLPETKNEKEKENDKDKEQPSEQMSNTSTDDISMSTSRTLGSRDTWSVLPQPPKPPTHVINQRKTNVRLKHVHKTHVKCPRRYHQ